MAKHPYRFPLLVMAFLFFMFGFITVMNNSSIEFLQQAFGLNEVQKQLPNTFFYGAYVSSIPVGFVIKRIGYKNTIFVGLSLIAIGFFASVSGLAYGYAGFLSTLSIFAIGVVAIQVSTAPYVLALGSPETSASRLTFANAMNSVATVLAPIFVSHLFITPQLAVGETLAPAAIQNVLRWPYYGIGLAVLGVLLILFFLKLPAIHSQQVEAAKRQGSYKASAFHYKHVWLGSLAIFFYLGAEIGIPSFFGDFVAYKQVEIQGTSTDMLTLYWGGLLVGRLLGMVALQRIKPGHVLLFSCVSASIMLMLAMASQGNFALWLYLGTGLFHSIMFPVVNSLALKDLGPHADVASGVINTSVLGAALLLPLMGGVQGITGTVTSALAFLFVYYAYIAFFGIRGARYR